jgi:hypothetical protein
MSWNDATVSRYHLQPTFRKLLTKDEARSITRQYRELLGATPPAAGHSKKNEARRIAANT